MNSLITVSNPMIFEMIGVAGFGLYVMNYTLLTFHKLHSHDALYFAINLLAAALVLTGLLVSFNLASAMIQSFWVIISFAAIIVRLRRRAANRARDAAQADAKSSVVPMDSAALRGGGPQRRYA